jgi:hypothetical protein
VQSEPVNSNVLRLLLELFVVGAILSTVFVVTVLFFPGDNFGQKLLTAYTTLWENTTRDKFTSIMRAQPWLYGVPATGLVFMSGWKLATRSWGRAAVVYIIFSVGFVGGHVFW